MHIDCVVKLADYLREISHLVWIRDCLIPFFKRGHARVELKLALLCVIFWEDFGMV